MLVLNLSLLLCYPFGDLEEDGGNLPLFLLACLHQVEMGTWPSCRRMSVPMLPQEQCVPGFVPGADRQGTHLSCLGKKL